jgi:tetratricopeptide (TPR) repeat protein
MLLWRAVRRFWWFVRKSPQRRLAIAVRALNVNRSVDDQAWQRSAAAVSWALFQLGEYETAENTARHALSRGDLPTIARAHSEYALAKALAAQSQWGEAASVLAAATEHFYANVATCSRWDRIYFAEAMILYSLALDEASLREEALGKAREAVVICRETPGAFASTVVTAEVLPNLVSHLRCSRLYEEALETAAEARDTLGPLRLLKKSYYGPRRGTLLTDVGMCQSALGRTGEAVSTLRLAVADLGSVPGWEERRRFAEDQLAAVLNP